MDILMHWMWQALAPCGLCFYWLTFLTNWLSWQFLHYHVWSFMFLFFLYRCDICIEVHPDGSGPHHHHHHHDLNLEGLEDGLEGPQLPQVTEVEVQMQLASHHHTQSHNNLPPQYHYLHQPHTGFRQVGVRPAQPQPQPHPPQYNHPPTTYNNVGHSQQIPNNRVQFQSHHAHHHLPHQHSEGSGVNSSSRLLRQQPHIPISGSSSSGHLLPHQSSLQQLHYNPNSTPGLLMVKTSNNSNGATSSSSESANTTPLTNVSPNLSTGSSTGGNKVNMSTEESEILRKRLYRVGLNLFNKKPEVGVTYLVKKKFLEGSPPSVARFLVSRKGLSKQMIGEYLTNLQSPYSMSCLEWVDLILNWKWN